MINFTIGDINVMDRVGGTSDSIDQEFLGDPFISAMMTVSDIEVLSPQNPDGSFTCTGGEVRAERLPGDALVSAPVHML